MPTLHLIPWLDKWLGPALLCAAVTWVSLLHRFAGRGRLLGSRRSAGLSAAIVTAVSAIAVTTSAVVLPHAAGLPPTLVGVAAGGTVARRGRRQQQDAVRPSSAALSLGITVLLIRLEERLAEDRADWNDAMVGGFKDIWQLRTFAFDVRGHLLDRYQDTKRKNSIEDRYKEAAEALDRALDVETRVGEQRRLPGGVGRAEPVRAATRAEEEDCRQAFGEAEHSVKLLVALAHEYGKRSTDRRITALRNQALHGTDRQPRLPQARVRRGAGPVGTRRPR